LPARQLPLPYQFPGLDDGEFERINAAIRHNSNSAVALSGNKYRALGQQMLDGVKKTIRGLLM
jgi:hypothetical protein